MEKGINTKIITTNKYIVGRQVYYNGVLVALLAHRKKSNTYRLIYACSFICDNKEHDINRGAEYYSTMHDTLTTVCHTLKKVGVM